MAQFDPTATQDRNHLELMMINILAAVLADPNVSEALKTVLRTPAEHKRVQAYVDALKAMDWTFEGSDDHRIWRAGRDELQRLRLERDAIDSDRVLWVEHAHADYRQD